MSAALVGNKRTFLDVENKPYKYMKQTANCRWHKQEYTKCDYICAEVFLENEDLETAKMLFITRGIKCTPYCADYFAENNNLKMVKLLSEEYQVTCTSEMANKLAGTGSLNKLKLLNEYGVKCTSEGANAAFKNNHIEVVDYLSTEQNVHYDLNLIEDLVNESNMFVLQELSKKYGLDCTKIVIYNAVKKNKVETSQVFIKSWSSMLSGTRNGCN